MLTRKDLIANQDLRYSKATGCMIGLAVGDTMGEIARDEYYSEKYGILTNLYGDSQSTDDTELAILTAKIVLACDGNLTDEVVLQHWMKHVVEDGLHGKVGPVSRGARVNLMRGLRAPISGQDNHQNYDDAAAMRVAPVGIVWAGNPEQAAKMAEIDAHISNYTDGVWAAQAIAASIAIAMVDGDIDEIVQAGLDQIPPDSWLGRSMARAMKVCDEEKTLENAWERLHDELWTPYRAIAAEAIPQTYAIFRLIGERGFKTSMIAGSNFGRDADTIGAMIGALAGAKYGMEEIPENWVEIVRQPRGVCLPFTAEYDMVDLGKQLADLIK